MKSISIIYIILFIFNTLQAQQHEVITVENAEEFVEAIGSNRIIQLKGNTIYLSELGADRNGENFYYQECYDGHELVINNVVNMKIIGLGAKPVKIITKPTYGDVIEFKNCEKIHISNVDAGHGPEKGGCVGGVFHFIESTNISIDKSIMYGSGIEGITAEKTTNLKCTQSIIRGCTYSIMTLTESSNFEFEGCEFSDNKEYDLVNMNGCSKIKFSKCVFGNNQTGLEDFSDYALFNIENSSQIALKDCKIENNSTLYLCKSKNSIDFGNTKKENNSFKKGEYKQ